MQKEPLADAYMRILKAFAQAYVNSKVGKTQEMRDHAASMANAYTVCLSILNAVEGVPKYGKGDRRIVRKKLKYALENHKEQFLDMISEEGIWSAMDYFGRGYSNSESIRKPSHLGPRKK